MTGCPSCGQSMPEEVTWSVSRQNGQVHATVKQGEYIAWAMRSTEKEAKKKALLRLNYFKLMGMKPSS